MQENFLSPSLVYIVQLLLFIFMQEDEITISSKNQYTISLKLWGCFCEKAITGPFSGDYEGDTVLMIIVIIYFLSIGILYKDDDAILYKIAIDEFLR